jgi:hypothetical protein
LRDGEQQEGSGQMESREVSEYRVYVRFSPPGSWPSSPGATLAVTSPAPRPEPSSAHSRGYNSLQPSIRPTLKSRSPTDSQGGGAKGGKRRGRQAQSFISFPDDVDGERELVKLVRTERASQVASQSRYQSHPISLSCARKCRPSRTPVNGNAHPTGCRSPSPAPARPGMDK